MAVALVVAPRDEGELAQLPRRQGAIGNGDAKHIGMQLQIDAIHQAKRPELFLVQFARQTARDLVAKLRHPLGDKAFVEFIVTIHVSLTPPRQPASATLGISNRNAFALDVLFHRAISYSSCSLGSRSARRPDVECAKPLSGLAWPNLLAAGPRRLGRPTSGARNRSSDPARELTRAMLRRAARWHPR